MAADRLQEVSALRAQKEALINEVDKLRYEVRGAGGCFRSPRRAANADNSFVAAGSTSRLSHSVWQLIELPQHIIESTPAYRSLVQTLDNLRRDATEARTAEADWRAQLLEIRKNGLGDRPVRPWRPDRPPCSVGSRLSR